jgi:peptidoglycan hydrolase-like protein with peptidoglycan-binding domain
MARTARYDIDEAAFWRSSWTAGILQSARRRPTDVAAGVLATLAIGAIVTNALFLQSGPHPAPIFANAPPPAATPNAPPAPVVELPRARPAEPARPRTDVVIAEIQRALAQRGFYDGAADGIYGPRTDSAIRDFEEAAKLTPSAEPNDVLLAIINRSSIKAKPAAARRDPIAELLAPNRRVLAVQRALTDFGYGQIKPTGVLDPETRAAIRRFEQERKLPVSGQVSDRLTRELTAVTGRPLE